jgi:hypothetical protein
MAAKDCNVTSLMVHMPQYAKLEADQMGTSRLMECICTIHNISDALADNSLGESQYRDIDKAVAGNPEIQLLIKQLETYYDRNHDPKGKQFSAQEAKLSPEIESFLNEIDEQFTSKG